MQPIGCVRRAYFCDFRAALQASIVADTVGVQQATLHSKFWMSIFNA